MSPVTHFLASWGVASFPKLGRCDIALVTLAGVAPDVDGIGAVPEVLTQGSAQPLDWFARYHHVLSHNLPFAIFVATVALGLGKRRWLTAGLAFLMVHLHFAMDVLGCRGADGYQWPIPYLEPFSSKLQLAWPGQWALNSRQNILITAGLLLFISIRTIHTGRSPVEIFSPTADKQVVSVLRQRWIKAAANGR